MYGRSAGAVLGTSATVGAVTLPNTGGNVIVSLAIAVAAGMIVWGVLYARATR